MQKRSFFLVLAAGLASAVLFTVPAQAGSIIVTSDSGGGSADVIGTATGATVNTAGFADTITEINGSAVSVPLSFGVNLIDTAGVFSGTGTKAIGTAPSDALLHFVVTDVFITGNGGDTLVIDGKVNAVPTNALPGYDFSKMLGAAVVITVEKTGTNFANVLNHKRRYGQRHGFEPPADGAGSRAGLASPAGHRHDRFDRLPPVVQADVGRLIDCKPANQ